MIIDRNIHRFIRWQIFRFRGLLTGFEVYCGVKNLFSFTPKDPLMRPFDPFDRYVDDPVTNPNRYTFDTTYGYAPMQKIRGFWELNIF